MIRTLAIVVALLSFGSVCRAASEIVVAIRYLQAQGESHAHLFLYREDGTLLRQLTKEERGQDLDPMFASDGETIVFTREIAENKFEYWSVERNGGGLKQLDSEPDWYANGPGSPYFVWPEMEGSGDDESAPGFGASQHRQNVYELDRLDDSIRSTESVDRALNVPAMAASLRFGSGADLGCRV